MVPTIGRIVHYKVSENDVQHYTFRPMDHPSFNLPYPGDVFPMVITNVNPDSDGVVRTLSGNVIVNNGTMFWTGSVTEGLGDVPGQWFWPPRVEENVTVQEVVDHDRQSPMHSGGS